MVSAWFHHKFYDYAYGHDCWYYDYYYYDDDYYYYSYCYVHFSPTLPTGGMGY